MHHRLYIHLAWTTKDRQHLIDAGLARFLIRFLRAMARRERSYILEIGMVRTHVHLLIRVHPMTAIPRLIQRLKGASSAVASAEGHTTMHGSLWAKGYSVQSVHPAGLEAVRRYLRQQPQRHPGEEIEGWEGDERAEYDLASKIIASASRLKSRLGTSSPMATG